MGTILLKKIILLYLFATTTAEECPSKCVCKRTSQRDGTEWIKVRCGEKEKVDYLEELDILNIASEIVQLNLSNNNLAIFAPKVQLVALQKLDLSRNQLTVLYDNQFMEIPNLRRLDLSENNIKHIETSAFSDLKHLERLRLNQNHINTIRKETFKPLGVLKQLDISSNPLTCDCDLLWLLDWTEKLSVKLLSNPKCSHPFKGRPLRKLKIGVDIHCKSPAGNREVPMIELTPNHGQVVFKGDSLRLHCTALSVTDPFDVQDSQIADNVTWQTNSKPFFNDVLIDNRFLTEQGIIRSTLTIPKLTQNHTGVWNCLLLTTQGNHTKGVTIMVISDETKYCPIASTSNNKGTYTWPRTITNNTVTTSCESLQLNNDISLQRASYTCSESGRWKHLNTSSCGYVSETTKILEQFSKVNLTVTTSTILESAKHFKNYTSDLKILKDVMDIVFVIKTIENYLNYLEYEKDLGAILLDVSNNMLDLPSAFIKQADVYWSCSSLTRALPKIASHTPSPLLHKPNIALEEFLVKQDAFSGMTCTWYVNPIDMRDRLFYCVTSNRSGLAGVQDKAIEASVQIPASLFYNMEQNVILDRNSLKLLVIMYSNSKFFPVKSKNRDITSAVVGVQLVDMPTINLTEPVYILLKSPPIYSYELSLPVPVWWDVKLNNGTGDWSSEGCQISHKLEDNLIFKCRQLGYYGLLQNIETLHYFHSGAKFRLSHPSIYVGSTILFLCLLTCVLTYLLCYAAIQMPKKAKHSLINTWIAVMLLCFVYVFGIYQTEDFELCQAIGLMLHYFTLSSLLWMCVSVNCMYKRLRKNDAVQLQDDELPSEEPVQKPILGLYFVGWGIALIICGISGAVNMKEYASHTHCFLNSGPSLSALFIPFSILVLFLNVFFLLIRCYVYNSDANGHLSEGTQATENVDLDLLEPNFSNLDTRSVRSISSKASSEMEDPEHAPIAQLKAYVIFLVMFVLTWFSCAFATAKPFEGVRFEEDVFSFLYSILAAALGMFALFFYCIARSDVRTRWVSFMRSFKRKKSCFRSRNVSDTNPGIPQAQPLPMPLVSPADVVPIVSRSSSRSSSRTKSHQSNALKAASDLNSASVPDGTSSKINNVNLLVLHRQQYVIPNIIENPTSSAEMFYNPHQSTVARKFFKRQKRHLMKHNNLQRRDVNSDNNSTVSSAKVKKNNASVDQKMFGTNSKVNNTNIHVERVRKTKQRNPNIFSDSCEDLASVSNIPIDALIKNAERFKKTEANKLQKRVENVSNKSSVHENNMRSVSQQCTLEYSSETISDSILNSPDKPLETQETRPRRENSPTNVGESLYHAPTLDVREKYKTDQDSESRPRIYVNPYHDFVFGKRVQSRTSSVSTHEFVFNKRVQSRASSVSASELDEIYQQIRRGPKSRYSQSQKHLNEASMEANPCHSDTEINSYLSDIRCRNRTMRKPYDGSDNETTV